MELCFHIGEERKDTRVGRNDGSLCSVGRVQSSSLVGRGYLWSREEAWNERRRAERRREKEGEGEVVVHGGWKEMERVGVALGCEVNVSSKVGFCQARYTGRGRGGGGR